MLKLYRGMKEDADGLPVCGHAARTLGARIPGDITPDAAGRVTPQTGGMSVTARDPWKLPFHRRPNAFGGMSRDPVYAIEEDRLGERLTARPEQEGSTHWFVEPSRTLPAHEYLAALWTTRPAWAKVRPCPPSTTTVS